MPEHFEFLKLSHPDKGPAIEARPYCKIRSQQEILKKVLSGILQKKGILVLIGENGTGKTTLLSQIGDACKEDAVSIPLSPPYPNTQKLLETICKNFSIDLPHKNNYSNGELVQKIEDFVLGTAGFNKHTILLVDHAECLSPKDLEMLRLLSNLMTETRRLITLVLAGLPNFQDQLMDPKHKSFHQRVYQYYYLTKLGFIETREFFTETLELLLGPNEIQLNDAAFRFLYRLTKGELKSVIALQEKILQFADKNRDRWITESKLRSLTQELKF